MTENEAIKDIKRQLLEIDSEDADITLSTESLKMAIQALSEIQQYRAIGTVEEFKDLKNTDIPIIHGKAELDLHDKEVRNKAIDDFVKEIEAEYDNDYCPNVADYLYYEISIRKLFEIAKQLKGE